MRQDESQLAATRKVRGRLTRLRLSVTVALAAVMATSVPGCELTAGAIPSSADESTQSAESEARIEGDAELTVNVGMQGYVRQILLPGSELTARVVDPRTTSIILRVDEVYPHGDSLRYDLTWFGMEPGQYDLADYLTRVDGSATDDLPAIMVEVQSVLPSDLVEPNPPDQRPRAYAGGYRILMVIAVLIWIAGFIAIIVKGRRDAAIEAASQSEPPLSRIQRIETLLSDAVNSSAFDAARKAELEGLIVGFWRERKGLRELSAKDALTTLRSDSDAGPLLEQLERWLYDRPSQETVDLNEILAPMKSLLTEGLDDNESP